MARGMAVAQYMVVGLFMVAVMVMVVMDLAVAPLSLLPITYCHMKVYVPLCIRLGIPITISLTTTPFEPFIFSREQLKFMGQ